MKYNRHIQVDMTLVVVVVVNNWDVQRGHPFFFGLEYVGFQIRFISVSVKFQVPSAFSPQAPHIQASSPGYRIRLGPLCDRKGHRPCRSI